MSSYQKNRDEFVAVIVEELTQGGRLPDPACRAVDVARLILRNAATIQRIAVAECNRELTAREGAASAACEARIKEACKPWRIRPNFNGDPRGACVKLLLPSGRYNSFGGAEDGYCVPTR